METQTIKRRAKRKAPARKAPAANGSKPMSIVSSRTSGMDEYVKAAVESWTPDEELEAEYAESTSKRPKATHVLYVLGEWAHGADIEELAEKYGKYPQTVEKIIERRTKDDVHPPRGTSKKSTGRVSKKGLASKGDLQVAVDLLNDVIAVARQKKDEEILGILVASDYAEFVDEYLLSDIDDDPTERVRRKLGLQ